MSNTNDTSPRDDHYWMKYCLMLAEKAAREDEVPVGAVVVRNGELVGEGYNRREQNKNALDHAEIIAIEEASRKLSKWRLSDCTLYVTLEPCLMCAGALVQARVGQVVYGTKDPKAGAMGSLYQVHEDSRLNHRIPMRAGMMAEECGKILQDFFAKKRKTV